MDKTKEDQELNQQGENPSGDENEMDSSDIQTVKKKDAVQNLKKPKQEEKMKGITPEQELSDLEKKVDDQKAELDQLTKENKTCQQDRAALDGLIKEFKKILNKYADDLKSISEQKEGFGKYSERKTDMIETAIKGHEDEIKEIIDKVNGEIKDLAEEVKTLKTEMEGAQERYEAAKDLHEKKQEEMEGTKSHQKTIQDNFKSMTNLRQTIESEEKESNFAVIYYLPILISLMNWNALKKVNVRTF
jgi:chromosome segregation ATPase